MKQQPLLFMHGLEAVFTGAAGMSLWDAACTAAELLRTPIAAAATNTQEATAQQHSGDAAAEVTAAYETAAFSMLLAGLRRSNKAAADYVSLLSTADSCGIAAMWEGFLMHGNNVKLLALQEAVSCCRAMSQVQLSADEIVARNNTQQKTQQQLLASLLMSTVLLATALHAVAANLLALQAGHCTAVGKAFDRSKARRGRSSSSSSSSSSRSRNNSQSSSSKAAAEILNINVGLARDLVQYTVLGNVPKHLAQILGNLMDAGELLHTHSSWLSSDAPALAKMQQQSQSIKAQLTEVGCVHVPAAAAAVAAAANPTAVLAAAAAAYDRQLLQQLQQHVTAVAALFPVAVLGACSNIGCSNMEPGMKLSRCSSCKACFFCGSDCQVKCA
jgi:hypothetical protein